MPSDPSSLALILLQVVKAFVVLAPQFLSRDPEQLTRELQQHVKSVTAPYKYPRKVRALAPQIEGEMASSHISLLLAVDQDSYFKVLPDHDQESPPKTIRKLF